MAVLFWYDYNKLYLRLEEKDLELQNRWCHLVAISFFLIHLQKGDKSSNQDDWPTPSSPTLIYTRPCRAFYPFGVAEDICVYYILLVHLLDPFSCKYLNI